ncbi:hypothetical protein [Variovorax sp. dw_308]|uniref:hypothetical protein n=1 Tax=Variovorax sp. dw_308 TaxID=2721546 RepID=UPI00210DFBD8|nr:hypothetical protein [Variovorax sp. dw_308]
MPFRPFFPGPVACLIPVIFLAATGAAHAQALPAGVRLGMTAAELQAVLPTLERVPRPQRLAGGLAGAWHGAPGLVSGLPLETTWYFGGAQLKRVEFTANAQDRADLGADAFNEIVAWGRGAFGPELASRDSGSEIASWVDGGMDVYVQRVGDAHRASVRLVYKARVLKDGAEL